MTESAKTILNLIDRTRASIRTFQVGLGTSWIIFVSGVSLAVLTPLLVLGGAEGSWGIMAACVKLAAFGGILFALVRWFATAAFMAPDRLSTALKIERALPGINNDLVVGLELIEKDEGALNVYSHALAGAHIEAAALRLESADVSGALPRQALQRAALAAMVSAAMVMGLALLWPGPTRKAAEYLLSAGITPNGDDFIGILEQPLLLGDFEIRYDYPAYTGWERKTVSGSDGSLRAIKGAVATIRATSLSPLKNAQFQMIGDTEQAGMPSMRIVEAGPHIIEGSFTLLQPGRYRIIASGERGENFVESSAHTIEIVPDAYPTIEIVKPAADMEVEEAGVLAIEFTSEDDFGIGEVAVVYSIDGSISGMEGRVEIFRPERGDREVSGTYTWDISALNLRPGDSLRYYLEAVDNDEVSGPKKGSSRTFSVDIFSPRKEHNRLVDLQWELLDRMVLVLGDTLVREPMRGDRITEEALKPDKLIAEGLEDLVNRIDEITTGLEKDSLADLNTYELLKNIKSELRHLLSLRKRAVERSKPGENELAARQAKEIPVLEKDIIALDNELERQKVSEVLKRGDQLLDAQRNLTDLLAKAQAGDEKAIAQLEREIARMRELMKELMEALSRNAGNMPEDFMNVDAMKNAPISQSADLFQQMMDAINDGDLAKAMELAQQMQDMMAQMMAAMEAGAFSFGMSRNGEAFNRLQELSQNVSDLKKRQKKLFDESQEIGVDMQQDLLDAQKKAKKNAIEELWKKLAELREETTETKKAANGIEPIDPKLVNKRFYGKFNNLSNTLHQLLNYYQPKAEKALDEGGLYTLRALMQNMLRLAEQSKINARGIHEMKVADKGVTTRVMEGSDRMTGLIEDILEMIEELLEPPERELDPDDLKRLNEMTNEQMKLKQDTEALQKAMEEFRAEFPMMDGEQPKKIGEAAGEMQSAGKKLGATDPNGALPPEAMALKKLGEVEGELEGLQQRMMQGAMGMPMPMPGGMSGHGQEGYNMPGLFRPGKVEIPGREGYKVPEEYRGDILRAMKNPSPEQYENLNRDYYKKLVK